MLETSCVWIVAPSLIGGSFILKDNRGMDLVPEKREAEGNSLKRLGFN